MKHACVLTNDLNPKTTYSETELVDLLQQRNEKAFSYLYDNYSGALYGIVNAIVTDNETANDVLQNVFVNIWKKIETYDPSKGRLFTWMLNIARNASIDELRSKGHRDSKKNQPLGENVDVAGPVTGPVTGDVGLRKILSRLKEEWRVLVELSYFQGFTHEEISRQLAIAVGTSKSQLFDARRAMRALLQPAAEAGHA